MNEINNINTLRFLGVDMIDQANSGHPGIVMGAAPMLYTLYTRHIKVNPKDSDWFNRDRFVMSAGHGSALLYSMLYLSGYKITLNDLKNFRQVGSITPGHPEVYETDGVDSTSGPLGQGIATAVGFAMAEENLRAKTDNSGYINHYTYALCGDGDLQEGVSFESMSIAGKNKLGRLIVLMDSNDIQLDSEVKVTTDVNMKAYIESIGWEHIFVKDGEDIEAIDKAIAKAKTSDIPTLIEVKTIIGFGSKNQGTSSVHGSPFGPEETKRIKDSFKFKFDKFGYDEVVKNDISKLVEKNSEKDYKEWKEKESNFKNSYKEISSISKTSNRASISHKIDIEKISKNAATRSSSGEILNNIQKDRKIFFGGSADLTASTKVQGLDGNFSPTNRKGSNIKFGVREFAMGAIANAINLHGGLISFSSTFLTFSDYMKPALRMAAIMKIPSISIYTHDSVFVGEDGPTHEPIEQVAMIRSIPNFADFRPADTNELVSSWEMILSQTKTPSALMLTRQNMNELEGSSIEKAKKGAYSIYGDDSAEIVIFSSGSEVELSINVAKEMQKKGITTKVVSVVSSFVFDLQGKDYYNNLVGKAAKKVTIEAAVSNSLSKYISFNDVAISIDRFGLSGPGISVYKELGFDKDKIVKRILDSK